MISWLFFYLRQKIREKSSWTYVHAPRSPPHFYSFSSTVTKHHIYSMVFPLSKQANFYYFPSTATTITCILICKHKAKTWAILFRIFSKIKKAEFRTYFVCSHTFCYKIQMQTKFHRPWASWALIWLWLCGSHVCPDPSQ